MLKSIPKSNEDEVEVTSDKGLIFTISHYWADFYHFIAGLQQQQQGKRRRQTEGYRLSISVCLWHYAFAQ